jgi:dihydrofolate reductase
VARLVYSAITSLDGFVADAEGRWDWSVPDEEVHRFVNEREGRVGTYLLGRRMYEVLVAWESPELVAGQPDWMREYADVWRDADKVVYSRTLAEVSSARTRIEREFDPDAVRSLKASADCDVSVGGPGLAEAAIRAGLVDEVSLLVSPVVVGGGTPVWPAEGRWDLSLEDVRRFGNGVVHLLYRVA